MIPVPYSARLLSSISSEERLSLLREHDRLRQWEDINEVRTCVCCSRKLTGRLIQIWSDANRFWFACPTSGCRGSLSDFARAGDPLFDDDVWEDWCKTFEARSFDERLDEAV
jgi:hypothetical protein